MGRKGATRGRVGFCLFPDVAVTMASPDQTFFPPRSCLSVSECRQRSSPSFKEKRCPSHRITWSVTNSGKLSKLKNFPACAISCGHLSLTQEKKLVSLGLSLCVSQEPDEDGNWTFHLRFLPGEVRKNSQCSIAQQSCSLVFARFGLWALLHRADHSTTCIRTAA